LFVALACVLLLAPSAWAQQTGSIIGRVTGPDGSLLPGVQIEARSAVLPGPRSTISSGVGTYQLPALPPGEYTVKFTFSGMQEVTKTIMVRLNLETTADIKMDLKASSETVTVTAGVTLVDKESAAVTSTLSAADFQKVPIGQEYRDLMRLLPGVQYTQDQVRGPSAGASGQSNTYNFDGVNVTLPLFGTLSAEPATHDIAQVQVVKGGATATAFNRAGGFSVDSISKSGSSQVTGEASFQFQTPGMAAAVNNTTLSKYAQTRTWTTVDVGGPLVKDRAYYYGSYYRPGLSRDNRANAYGDLPKFSSARDEGYGKLTLTPAKGVLINGSFRDSHRLDKSSPFGQFSASTTGTGNEATLRIVTGDGSWVIDPNSVLSFKFTHFTNLTQGRPDNVANVTISTNLGTQLDVANLEKMGAFSVPSITASTPAAFNAFVQPLIDKYGFVSPTTGLKTGGGAVGYGSLFDKDDFFRTSGEVAYNRTLNVGLMRNQLHAGYQQYVDAENLTRSSNGWGSITVPGGRVSFPATTGTPIFYQAAFQQQGFGTVTPTIHSEYRSQILEFNDAIGWKQFSFNVGLLAGHDTLYGQGLNNASLQVSGYVLASGRTPHERQYKMYDIPFSKLIQPRLGATFAYDRENTVYVSYAKYNPAASSLPRAAAWDRNLATTINAYFDANGVLFATDPVVSSTGKLFVANMDPPRYREVMVGTSRQLSNSWSTRVYFRYKKGDHFWEDTNNNSRQAFAPPAGIPTDLYIPDLAAKLTQIGSGGNGNSYVIAELDGAFTRYKEVTAEMDYHGKKLTARMSYTWSRYFGNFDQDGTSTASDNDANRFIGSSNIGDGAGRQLWDNKLGLLHGDRPNSAKLFGSYQLPWQASIGLFAVAQSGQIWEATDSNVYRALTSSTSDTIRYAEPAGSRRTAPHAQVDINYTQRYKLDRNYSVEIAFDVFNVLNTQTGYNPQPSKNSSLFGLPQSLYDPLRTQLVVRLLF
jgi:hypothetical protein